MIALLLSPCKTRRFTLEAQKMWKELRLSF
jgi:hypothetical protein